MTARCALYKWIEGVVGEIRPFEIIQDGGLLTFKKKHPYSFTPVSYEIFL